MSSAKLVGELKPTDLVDLYGDPYADPFHNDPAAENEYGCVSAIEQETDDCIRVDFENRESCGFPPNHYVKMAP